MEVKRIISDRGANGVLKEYTIRKQIDIRDIVSYEEFVTQGGTRSLYVYANTHQFVIDRSFDSFREDIKMERLITNE